MKQINVGDPVIFVDSQKRESNAIVTSEWGGCTYDDDGNLTWAPCINLVLVSLDETKMDSWGRQVERHSSVSHSITQGPTELGMCWRFID